MKNILITSLFIIASLFTFSQDGFEGEVTYKISYKNLPEEMGMYKAMLPKKTKIVIKNEWSNIEQNMMVVKMNVISNSKTKKSVMLIKGMGQKIAMETEDTTQQNGSSFTVTKTTEMKIIEGYKCNKVMLKDTGSNEIVMWITKELPAYKNNNLPDVELDGFPMEFSFEKDNMKMRMTASKIDKKKIDDKEFEIPEGYEKKTPEEMAELFGNMDGMKM